MRWKQDEGPSKPVAELLAVSEEAFDAHRGEFDSRQGFTIRVDLD